ncbi:MAG: 50S ribosomal protein L10 [Acidobacteriota bacterium]|nr:50S ribosomal protein L10 [Acidobacteriota bacterium]
MALDKQTKVGLVETYSEGFVNAQNAFVVSFRGISVPQADDLRSKVRATGAHYLVVKNRLALIALKDTKMECLGEHFSGPTAVAFHDDDAVSLAKVLTEFKKEADVLEFRAGLVDGAPVAADDIKAIAELQSRDELIAKLLFLLQSPIIRVVRGLGAITRDFVVVLEQIRQQKE